MENRDYLELTFRSINVFANDGKLDAEEFRGLVEVALRDGIIDENERRVLAKIIGKVKDSEMTDELKQEFAKLKACL